MASLKEVKTRISSVNSTRKITSAMKMVASSKLHHAQQAIEQMRPYEEKLSGIMSTFVASLEDNISSPYAEVRELQRVAVVVFSSNSSLCGGFNGNTLKKLKHSLDSYKEQGVEIAKIYPIGKKISEAVRKLGYTPACELATLLDHPNYSQTAELAAQIMNEFNQGDFDKVILIYHHFKSAGTQILTEEQFLPIQFPENAVGNQNNNFLVEPSPLDLIEKLIPKSLHLKLYSALLDSLASEHASRVIAMQVATDNADELLRDLTLQYNKTRQQAITAELLDIVGGSMQ
ncbi:MAG: F0F1 ATP synthase subunit gamma [Alloprevotella sp.]|nr:MAG: F0F1 ATP synthase subunit gamma [Alloprevotella sp.]